MENEIFREFASSEAIEAFFDCIAKIETFKTLFPESYERILIDLQPNIDLMIAAQHSVMEENVRCH